MFCCGVFVVLRHHHWFFMVIPWCLRHHSATALEFPWFHQGMHVGTHELGKISNFVISAQERRYDASRGMSLLMEDWVSRASALQRRGRAGRVRPGRCFGLYTRHRFEERMRKYQARLALFIFPALFSRSPDPAIEASSILGKTLPRGTRTLSMQRRTALDCI